MNEWLDICQIVVLVWILKYVKEINEMFMYGGYIKNKKEDDADSSK